MFNNSIIRLHIKKHEEPVQQCNIIEKGFSRCTVLTVFLHITIWYLKFLAVNMCSLFQAIFNWIGRRYFGLSLCKEVFSFLKPSFHFMVN